MAVSGADASLENRVSSITLDRYGPEISNEIKRKEGIVEVFGSQKAIKVVSGGQRAIEILDKAENNTFGFQSRYADFTTTRQDTRTQAKYAWATLGGAVNINKIDRAMNQGESRIFDLFEAEVKNAKNTVIRKLADAFRAASPGVNDPESIRSIIQDTTEASQTGSMGEISRPNNISWWRNAYSNTAMDLSAAGGFEAFLAFYMDEVSKGVSSIDQPNFGITTGTLFAALAAGRVQDLTRYSPTSDTAKLGVAHIQVMNAIMIADPSMPTGDVFLANTNHLKLQILRTEGMKDIGENPESIPISIGDFVDDIDSLHSIALMYVTLALTCSSLQRQGIATNCS